jgi:hypothetical protein
MWINSTYEILHRPVLSYRNQEEIKNESMLFNCDMEHAYKQGGSITKEFLNLLPLEWHDCPVVIDTRVHMLMPGWFPCIPGWHHDDVPRTREDGQPNYDEGQDRSFHIVALVNGDIAPTEFAIGKSFFTPVPIGQTVYATWHHVVEDKIKDGVLIRTTVPTNRLVMFDDRAWHRGTSTIQGGWRWFGRISRYFDKNQNAIQRKNSRTNEVRRQVQVYLPAINGGW